MLLLSMAFVAVALHCIVAFQALSLYCSILASLAFYTFATLAVCILLYWLLCFVSLPGTPQVIPRPSYEQQSFILYHPLDYDALVP